MSLFELDGTITAIGQSVFDNNGTVYAYLEITEPGGGRTLVEKVAVCNDVGSQLSLGLSGRFYVDRIFRESGPLRCQLWGLKTEHRTVVDRKNLRKQIGIAKVLYGILTIPVLGIGFILIVSGIRMLVLSQRYDRNRFFFGGAVPPPLPLQTARI
jgi:hypothetical protein